MTSVAIFTKQHGSRAALVIGVVIPTLGMYFATSSAQVVCCSAIAFAALLVAWRTNRAEPANEQWQIEFFEASPDPMVVLDERSQSVSRINKAFTDEFGYTPEDMVGSHAMEFGLWENPETRDRLISQLYERGQDARAQAARLKRKDGSIVVMDAFLRHISLHGQRGALLKVRDVSEREQALTKLLDSQQKFLRVFDHTPDCIAISNVARGEITEVNDAFLRVSGYSRTQVLGKSFIDLNIFPNIEQVISGTEQLKRFGSYRNHEVMVRRRDGVTVPTLVAATLFEVDGETMAMTIAKDLRELRHTELKLQDSQHSFDRLFDNASVGFLLLDEDLTILRTNRFTSRLLECTDAELVGTSLLSLVPANHQSALKDRVNQLRSDGDVSSDVEEALTNFAGKDVWVQSRLVAHKNKANGAMNYLLQVADISEVKAGQLKMVRMAHYDSLTELPNRTLFTERLDQLIKRSDRAERMAAVLYIDLDQFKRVNDTLGHDAGDQLLRTVAQRLRNCVRRQDTVARLGGDEFTLLLEDIKTVDAAQRVAEKILETMAQQLTVTGHELVVTPSIGITLFPGDANSASGLLRNADLAMYQAKSRGRNNYQFFAQGMNERAIARLQTESELLNALHNGEFELYFQPKVALEDLSVIGAEALLRWHHPTRGTLTPDSFVSVAEESGAIVEIGRWVISEACRASREFSDHCGRPINVAINLSARQFGDPNLVNEIRQTIDREGADPANIEFEITETMLMSDVERAAKMLQRLRNLGLSIAIDDFGTGYSSFNYLKKFPIGTVKIDRSFVMDIPHNPDDMAISAAVIAMSQRLNLRTVAEGVETREQLEFLQQSGCEFAQGFLFAPGLPKPEFLPLVTPNVAMLGVEGRR